MLRIATSAIATRLLVACDHTSVQASQQVVVTGLQKQWRSQNGRPTASSRCVAHRTGMVAMVASADVIGGDVDGRRPGPVNERFYNTVCKPVCAVEEALLKNQIKFENRVKKTMYSWILGAMLMNQICAML